MKTRGKQLNKNLAKEQNREVYENCIDVLRRTSGTKPFQLSKIRGQKRSSLETVNPGSRIDFPRNKSQIQQYAFSEQTKDHFLDLMINKKALFNNHHNKILQSERKDIIYVAEIQNTENSRKATNQVNQTEFDNVVEGAYPPNQSEVQPETNQTCNDKKRSKCQCCLHLNHYLTQAVIKRSQTQILNANREEYTQKSNAELRQDEINALIQLKYVKQKVEKSPFSFTSLKWRTKSEHFQIDKWKEKYGKHDLDQYGHKAEGLSKVLKGGKTQRINRSQEPLRLRQKIKQPSLLTSHQRLPSLTKLLANKAINPQSQNILQVISQEQSRQPMPLFTAKYQDLELMLDSYRHSGFRQVNNVDPTFNTTQEPKNLHQNIGIKEGQIYLDNSSRKVKQDTQENQLHRQKSNEEQQTYTIHEVKPTKQKAFKQTAKTKGEKIFKKKVDKIRFPSIQGAAVRPSKQIQEKKPARNLHPQRIDYSWKEKLSRKVYLSKMMQQIPERWEYGESRDQSREVDSYMKIKQEEDRILREEEERSRRQQQEKIDLLVQKQKQRELALADELLPNKMQNQQQQM